MGNFEKHFFKKQNGLLKKKSIINRLKTFFFKRRWHQRFLFYNSIAVFCRRVSVYQVSFLFHVWANFRPRDGKTNHFFPRCIFHHVSARMTNWYWKIELRFQPMYQGYVYTSSRYLIIIRYKIQKKRNRLTILWMLDYRIFQFLTSLKLLL